MDGTKVMRILNGGVNDANKFRLMLLKDDR